MAVDSLRSKRGGERKVPLLAVGMLLFATLSATVTLSTYGRNLSTLTDEFSRAVSWVPVDSTDRAAGDSGTSASPSRLSALEELMDELNSTSLRILLRFLASRSPTDFVVDADANGTTIDTTVERERCRRYDFPYHGRTVPRRIFFGGLVADDSWHVLAAHAAETYGMYHTAAFVESDRTQTYHRRRLRFRRGSVNERTLRSGIFGEDAVVTVDFFNGTAGGGGKVQGLLREHMQRDVILKRWKRNGMRPDDLGIVGDVDEFFTRDFLRALQFCDVPVFRPGQDCMAPKILGRTLVFESSPECITDHRDWYHPDVIVGECIDTIGDAAGRPPAPRVGRLPADFRKQDWRERVREQQQARRDGSVQYPLWRPVDFRNAQGGSMKLDTYSINGTRIMHYAYHLHNFFDSFEVLRHKYKTYGHPVHDADTMPLSEFHDDVVLAVNCVMDRPDKNGTEYSRKAGGFAGHVGPRPLAFEVEEYRKARHEELRDMVVKDEAEHADTR